MSWIYELYKTYENCFSLNEIHYSDERTKVPLLPLFHMLKKSHIDIFIDENGNFLSAKVIVGGEYIIIPCTEDSAVRTSDESPHPLCEKIQYCAKDYVDFGGKKKPYYKAFIKQLKTWVDSEYSHYMVEAVYSYLEKGKLVNDLIDSCILITDEKNRLVQTWPKNREKPEVIKLLSAKKEKGASVIDQGDLFVRWNIEKKGNPESSCWKSSNLINSWISYNLSQDSIKDLCIVRGRMDSISTKHPKGIRGGKDSGKLISSNDSKGFTFLGRFENANQAATISADVSQKAHNTLKWLIDRQCYLNGDQVIVSWAVSGKETPDAFADTFSILGDSTEEKSKELSTKNYNDAGQTFARKLSKKIAGYKAELSNTDKIVVMGLDSAVPGRISITYYRELTGSDFLERIESWHKKMVWRFKCYHDKKQKKIVWGSFELAPSPETIAEACYGTKRDEDFKKYRRSVCERLLPCIVDGRNLPIDLVFSAIKKASNRLAYSENEKWQWEQALSVACALYSCYSIRENKSLHKTEKIMALEKERTDRDYLYGRLLAVAEHIEERALFLSKENRETNAARMMHIFSEQPFHTWAKLYDRLSQGYFSRLQARRPGFLYNMKNLIGEIKYLFQHGDFEKNEKLSGLYLLGYHCQRLDLNNQNKTEDDNNESENI